VEARIGPEYASGGNACFEKSWIDVSTDSTEIAGPFVPAACAFKSKDIEHVPSSVN